MSPDAPEHPSGRPGDLDRAIGDDDRLTDSDVVEQDAAREGRVEMSHNNAAPPNPLDSVKWIEENVRDERFLLPHRKRLQPQRLADLATHLYRVRPARRTRTNLGRDADRASAALALGTKAAQTWLLSGGFDAVMGRPLDGVARRQAARISNRGVLSDLDNNVVGMMRYVIVTRLSGTETADGGFIAWGRDTSRPIRDVLLPRLHGISSECIRAYRKYLGMRHYVRVEAKGEPQAWIAGLTTSLTQAGGPADRFAEAAQIDFRWPAAGVWNDETGAKAWAIRGWFNGFFDDAGQTRPTVNADVHRIARHLDHTYEKEHGTSNHVPLATLANQFEEEWTAVVLGCEQVMETVLPKKFAQLQDDRSKTVQATGPHQATNVVDDVGDWWQAFDDDPSDFDDRNDSAGAIASIDSDERNDDTTELTGSFDEDTIDRAVQRLLGLDGTPGLDADTVTGLLVGVAKLVQGGREIDGEVIAANLPRIAGAGGGNATQGWVDELVRAASALQQGAATDGDGGQ